MSQFSSNDVAIVGMACRLPGGVQTPEDLWRLLMSGTDAVTTIPQDRWDHRLFHHPDPAQAGRSYTFASGTLGDVSGFDAAFFGISPREAEQMDPQQRLLLELAWEALERGGLVPGRLAGRSVAVYVGISSNDYPNIRQDDPQSSNAYFMLGSTLSIAANRISFVFDLKGPSLAIDTACSSGMMALHEAYHAVHSGRVPMALVGSVNMLLSPYPFVGFSKASMLSPTGRCRTFDRMGDGYVRAEGGGMLVLKPLADALKDADPICAVIRAAGANTDGKTPGIAMPSSEMQEALLRRTYDQAGIDPSLVSYFEAHGTGTKVGDPAETGAIGRAIAMRRPTDRPLAIGSIKSNIGHMEPASGMAGILKSLLILRHGTIPPTIHLSGPNPDIGFSGLNLHIPTEPTPLPETGAPAIIGVNSFGFGGANAHVVLQQYRAPAPIRTEGEGDAVPPLLLSARDDDALKALAARMADRLDAEDKPDWYDVTHSCAFRRTHHDHRLIVDGPSDSAIAALTAFAETGSAETVHSGKTVSPSGSKVAFIFSGNGCQFPGMGRALFEQDAAFRATFEHLDALIRAHAGWSPIEEMHADPASSRLDSTSIAQPMLLAYQLAMLASLEARGLRPDAVAGHSVGEVAAATCAGILDLEQAVAVILKRSGVQEKTKGRGRMAAVIMSPAKIADHLAPLNGAVEIAAYNSPRAVTLSGEADALRALGKTLKADGVDFRLLDLDYAFHSRILDPVQEDLLAELADIRPSSGSLAFYSTVTGARIDGDALDNGYWWRNLRQPVHFHDAIASLLHDGHGVLIEIGPNPIMQSYIRHVIADTKRPGQVLPLGNKAHGGADKVHAAVARAYTAGASLDLAALFPRPGNFIDDLPTYPWQRQRYWFPVTPEARGAMHMRQEGRLLGFRPLRGIPLWENLIDPSVLPFLADHAVGGTVLFPATGFVEVVSEAARLVFADDRVDVENLEIHRPLILEQGRSKVLRTVWSPDDCMLRIESRTYMQEEPWQIHVTARVAKPAHGEPLAIHDCLGGDVITGPDHYELARRIGLEYGPCFQTVHSVAVCGDQAEADLDIPDGLLADFGDYHLHPALFDGGLQALFDILARQLRTGEPPQTYLPQQIARFRLSARSGIPARCRVRLIRRGLRSLQADFVIIDSDGHVLAEAKSFRFQRAELTSRQDRNPLTATELVPLPPLSALPVPAEIASAVLSGLADPAAIPPTAANDLDRLAALFARDALTALGLPPDAEALDIAVDAGWGADDIGMAETLAALAGTAPPADTGDDTADEAERTWRSILASHPQALPEATLLGAAGLRLPDGDRDATAPFAPSASLLAHFWDASPTMGPANDRMAEAVRRMAADWPHGRRLRVLEVGAGDGGLSRRLLSVLPPDQCDLVLSDNDEQALTQLATDFADNHGVSVHRLDLLQDICAQDGWRAADFDIVVGSGVLHTVASPIMALETILALARPGAPILMADPAPARWLDLVFGRVSSWWRLSGDGSMRGKLLSAEEMLATAAATGLDSAQVVVIGGAIMLVGTRADEDATPMAAPRSEQASWLIVTDRTVSPLAQDLSTALNGKGVATHILDGTTFDPADTVSWEAVWESAPAGVVLLAVPDAPAATRPLPTLDERAWAMLAAAQGFQKTQDGTPRRLILVTRDALGFDHEAVDIAQAPAWGAGRVLPNEMPDLEMKRIDLAGQVDPRDLAAEILSADPEDEVLLGPDSRRGVRIRPAVLEDGRRENGDATVLAFTPGTLDHLHWATSRRRAPAAGEVEIAVRATGLNFRDVMFAMGLLPEEAVENGFAGATVGMEGSGIVTRVGDGVDGLTVGQPVLFFAPSCFASHVTTKTTAVAPMPEGLGFTEAATVPTVFFTIYYALRTLARLAKGDRILIHAAAGGVGIAAIQYARHVGAEIFATAGSVEKRTLVRLLGVAEDHILDSRSTAFADQIMALTQGQGIDVVLNSVAGEAVHKSLSILRPFGKFLELGKRDFYASTRISLRPFRNNLSYFGIDADQLIAERPDLASALFAEVVELFRAGVFTALPHRVFGADRVVDAFRYMQQAKHVGKIVVHAPQPPHAIDTPSVPTALSLDAQGSYLVTGGLGGFGLAAARWLAEKGAGKLVLVSRRGAATDEAAAAIAQLEAKGVVVSARACDVSDPAQVGPLIAELAHDAYPLKGILHAAAVFDDGAAAAMTRDSLRKVLSPKALGAWVLHQATVGLALDHFVMFSSITTSFGNPGQANYVAANLFQESLARHRRANGLPALAVAWGPIADAGYLTRRAEIAESLETRLGAASLTTERAFIWLERLMANPRSPAVLSVADVDWRGLRGFLPVLRTPRFIDLVGGGKHDGAHDGEDFFQRIAGKSPAEVYDIVTALLAETVGHVLRLPPEKIETGRPIFDFGMDSLMALELRMLIEEKTGIQLAAMSITQDVTVARLAERLRDQLLGGRTQFASDGNTPAGSAAELLRTHAENMDADDLQKVLDGMESDLMAGAKLVS